MDTLTVIVTVNAFSIDLSLPRFAGIVWHRVNVKGGLCMVVDTELVDKS
jgi:hypothetical protein